MLVLTGAAGAGQGFSVTVVCQVDRRRGELLGYIVFLRITPILPNIFINIASPVVNVPIGPFALGELGSRSMVLGSDVEWATFHVVVKD